MTIMGHYQVAPAAALSTLGLLQTQLGRHGGHHRDAAVRHRANELEGIVGAHNLLIAKIAACGLSAS